MATARPNGLFATHRGRAIRRGTTVALILSVSLMMVNGMVNGGSTSTEAATPTSRTTVEPIKPKVEYAKADLFTPDANGQVRIPVNGDSADFMLYQDMLVVAQKSAIAFETYGSGDTPQEYVDRIPGLEAKARKALLAQATENWAALGERKIAVTASPTASQVIPMAYEKKTTPTGLDEGSATMLVMLNRTASGDGVATTQGEAAIKVWLSLKATTDPDKKSTWVVTGLSR